MSVAVLIPTFRRPDGLARALRSVFAQTAAPDEIVVVDNAPEAGARAVTEALHAAAPCPLRYVAAPDPGVANARNAGFSATSARFIAQLDDDEEAGPGWLEALLTAQETLGASVVFGPVRAHARESGGVRDALLRRLYSRIGPDGVTRIDKPFGCGNSLIDRQAAAPPDPPFDPSTNETGGEDDLLFSNLAAKGASFGWACDARVIEHVDAARAAWPYLLRRSLAFGQGATQQCAKAEPPNRTGVAAWMAIGAAQSVIYALAAAPARAFGPRATAACLDRAVQGLGKVFWFERFEPRFYGSAAAEPRG